MSTTTKTKENKRKMRVYRYCKYSDTAILGQQRSNFPTLKGHQNNAVGGAPRTRLNPPEVIVAAVPTNQLNTTSISQPFFFLLSELDREKNGSWLRIKKEKKY
jgi:hypothetical protein